LGVSVLEKVKDEPLQLEIETVARLFGAVAWHVTRRGWVYRYLKKWPDCREFKIWV